MMHRILTIACSILLVAWMATRAIKGVVYEREVEGHLKLAADANNIELAEQKLKRAIEGMDRMGMCPEKGDDCYSNVLWRTPETDVGFWRSNIEATLEDLNHMTPEERSDNLIVSNQLIKVRETLLDSSKSGDMVTSPSSIAVYPNQRIFFWWFFLSLLGAFGGGFWWRVKERPIY